MRKEISLNETVKEALALALIRIMKEKDFSNITISELVKTAGVSRSSFYRNFNGKEDLLCKYLTELYFDYFESKNVPRDLNGSVNTMDFLLPRFRFIKENRTIFTALYNHNLLYYFFKQTESDLIILLCGHRYENSPYHRAMFSGACAGVIRLWIENDFRESEEKMASLFIYPIKP